MEDRWSAHAVPPVVLAHSADGLPLAGRRIHFALVDGHNRLSADVNDRGVPAMVTHRWSPDESGSLVGRFDWPVTQPDPTLSSAWNVSGQGLRIHAPESVQARSAWGHPEIRLCLPAACAGLSPADLAPRPDAFQPSSALLQPGHGDRQDIRVMLIDVSGDV